MLHLEEVRAYCLQKAGVTEELPFDENTLVFKVLGKAFLLTRINSSPFRFNLKMNPELIPLYREKYLDVQPGYHMNKNHWNTVIAGNHKISKKEIFWMIDHSYAEVVKGLPKKDRETLRKLSET